MEDSKKKSLVGMVAIAAALGAAIGAVVFLRNKGCDADNLLIAEEDVSNLKKV